MGFKIPRGVVGTALRAWLAGFCAVGSLHAQTIDTVVFGDTTSEGQHSLTTGWGPLTPSSWVPAGTSVPVTNNSTGPSSDVVTGALGQKARRLLPLTPYPDIYGGQAEFTMTVDPVRQNYLTIKVWGSDPSVGVWFVLNVDGLELGLRHGGDSAAPGMLFGNKLTVNAPLSVFAPNQWIYRTMAIPVHLTQGKTSVTLKLRSLGWISDYDTGAYFGAYNKLMNSPSLGLYRIYSHLGSKLDISGEAQGSGSTVLSPRTAETASTVISGIQSGINSQLSTYLGSTASSLSPSALNWMAQCYDAKEKKGQSWISYGGTNTVDTLVQKAIDVIDYHVMRQANDGNYVASFGNDSWGGALYHLGDAIRLLWPTLGTNTAALSTTVAYGGSYGTITRSSAWSKALRASVDYGRFNRRGAGWANQGVICSDHIYRANRGLLLIDPANALYESEALRYLEEDSGLLPYRGSDLSGGGPTPVPGAYAFGDKYYNFTTKGTTKDGYGFVGSDYGEMGPDITVWGQLATNSSYATNDAAVMTRAKRIFNRGLEVLRARAVFRFPGFDDTGYRIMQGANLIGVRNQTLPGHYGYLARGDGGIGIAALGTNQIGADLVGYYRNAISDGQALRTISGSKDPYMVLNWTNASNAATQLGTNYIKVPMSVGAADFAWADEENMVVAAKSGENRIFANLYWGAPGEVNGWAKIFHLPDGAAPEIAEVQVEDVRYRPTGTFQTLGPRVEGNASRQPPDNPTNAYNGVVSPVGWRSDLTNIPTTNVDGGKGTGYTLRYGHWLIGINAHYTATYDMLLPSNFAKTNAATNLVNGAVLASGTTNVTLQPKTSAVFYLPDVVDSAQRPARPMVLKAVSTTGYVALDWNPAAGAVTYNVKRATASGGPYTTIATSGTSVFLDSTAVAGTTYYYIVSALNASGLEGGDSPEASAALTTSGLVNRVSGGTASASLGASSYPAANAFDGNTGTKWNSGSTGVAAWLRYDFGPNITWAVTRYDITSASDTAQRDPNAWKFEGSNDGTNWTTLDSRSGETFASRALTKSYTFANSTGYRYYRLNVSAVDGGLGYEIQIAELGLYASVPGTVPVPDAPTGVTATSGNNNVFLKWTASGAAISYNIKRATSAAGAYTTIGTTDNVCFLDTSAPTAGTYYYVVAAVSGGGEGAASAPVSATYGPLTPAAPTGLTASSGPNAGNVTLRWSPPPGAPTYTIKRAASSGGPYTTLATGLADTVYIDTNRSNGTPYYYVVSATIGSVEGPNSAEVAITPQTFIWSSTSGGNWNVATNWGGTAPATNGSLLIFSGTGVSTTNNYTGMNIGGLVFNSTAGAYTLAASALTLGGNITTYSSSTQTISLGMTLSANRVIDVQAGQLTISGVVTDGANSFSLTKNGSGILALSGANTFDGGLYVNAGTLQLGTSTSTSGSGYVTSLGSAGSTVTLGAATLRFQMGNTSSTNTIPCNFVFNAGATVNVDDGKIVIGGSTNTIAVNGTTVLQSKWANKWLLLGGQVTGTADIAINNAGSTQTNAVGFINASNTYSGTITVENTSSGMAAVAVGNSKALTNATLNTLNTRPGAYSVWFDVTDPLIGALSGVEGSSIMLNTDGGLYGAGPATNNAGVTLSVGNNNADSVFKGNLVGTGGLTKVGTGTFTLAGVNTYSGTTTVNAGTLVFDTPHTAEGDIVVNGGGTLEADTSIVGTLVVNTNGIVSPGGDKRGTITVPALTLNAGARLKFEFGSSAGTDQIAITGGVEAYTPPTGGTATIEIVNRIGFGPGKYPLITGAQDLMPGDFTIGTTPPPGYSYDLYVENGTLSLVVSGPPAYPMDLYAYGRSNSVALVWGAAVGADGYIVYRSTLPFTNAGNNYAAIATTTSTSYTNTGLTNGSRYYYYLIATNSAGVSASSSEVSAVPQPNTWAASPGSLNWSSAANWGGDVPLDNAQLTFGSSSAYNLNNDLLALTVGGIVFTTNASAFTFSGNSILLSGDIVNNSTNTQTNNLQLTLLGTRTITANTGKVILNGAINDAGLDYGLIKNGAGTLVLAGTNSFTGGLAVNAGTVELSGDNPAGTGGRITVSNGTKLRLVGTTLRNPIIVPTGVTITLEKSGLMPATGNTAANYINGSISGGGTINEMNGSGGTASLYSINWNGDNTGFTGKMISANSGGSHRWRFNNPASGSASASWELNTITTDAYGFSLPANSTISFGSLSGSGSLRNDGNACTLRIGDLGTSTTFSGSTTSTLGFLKVGAGTLTLSSSALAHSGATVVSAGTLNVTGSMSSSATAVQSGGTLGGTGSFAQSVTINSGGILAPGNSGTGSIYLNGAFVPQAGSVLNFELGSTSDQIVLGSGSSYTAPSGGTVTINFSNAAGISAGDYTLIANNNTNTTNISVSQFTVGTKPSGYACALSMSNNSLVATLTSSIGVEAPTGLAVTSYNASTVLAWNAAYGATTYNVKRSTNADSGFVNIYTGATGTTYTDFGASNGTTYYYKVTGAYGTNESTALAAVGATPVGSVTNTFKSIAAQDGDILESSETSNTGATIDSTDVVMYTGDSRRKYQYLAMLAFDTSSIPTDANINSATLKMRRAGAYGTSPFTWASNTCFADIKGFTGFSSNTSLEKVDFAAPADLSRVASMSNASTTGAWSTGNLTNGLGAIAKGGNTQFRVYFSSDDNNNGTADYIMWSSGNDTNSAYWPVLEVVYAADRAPVGLTLSNRVSSGTASDSQNSSGTEGADKAFDGLATTKWYNGGTAPTVAAPVWLGYDFGAGNAWAIARYDITSASDVQGRDPKDWTVQGSNDGSTWTNVDTRSGEVFATRAQTKQYLVNSQARFRYYRLYITSNYGGSSYGVQLAELTLLAYDPPATPTGLSSGVNGTQTTLSWTRPTNAISYTIKRSTSSGGPYTTIATGVTLTTYTDTGLTSGASYYYVISAVGAGGESTDTSQVAVTAGVTTIPTGVPSLSATAGARSVALSWGSATGATSYNLKRSTTSGGSYTTIASGVTGTTYSNTNLTAGTTYYYIVCGVNSYGEGSASPEAGATPLPPAMWTGSGADGNWQTPANWSSLPLTGDTLLFAGSTQLTNTNNNYAAGMQFAGLVFNTNAGAFNLGGSNVVLTGGITNNSPTNQTIALPISNNAPSPLVISNTTGPITISGVLSGTNGWTKTGSGALTLQATNTFTGGFTILSGDTYISGLGTTNEAGLPSGGALGTGTVTLAGGRFIYKSGTNSLYNNMVATASTTTTFLEAVNAPLYLYGSISGSGNIVLDASVDFNGVRLAGDNSGFTGTMTLDSSSLWSAARHKFDSAKAGSAQAKWVFNGPTDSCSMNFGAGTIHFGELSGNAAQIRNNASGTANVSIGALNTSSTFNGAFSSVGTLAITKVGTGTLTLAGTNTHTGGTIVSNGTLALSGSGTLGGGGNAVTVAGGTLDLGTLARTNGAISISSGMITNGTLTGSSFASTDGGTIGAVLAGSGALTKNGAGTLTLAGTNTYSGATTISNGVLNVMGSIGGSGALGVNAAGVLSGAGSAAGAVTVASNGVIAPGNGGAGAAGTLTLSNSLTLNAGAVIDVDLAGTSSSDKVVVAGNVISAGKTTLNLSAIAGFAGAGSYPLITSGGTIDAASFTVGTAPSGYGCVLSATNGTLSATLIALPSAPAGLTALAGDTSVSLSWTTASGATGYNVKRSTTSGSGYMTLAAGIANTAYTDATVTNSSTYYYVVSAVNSGGESANSSETSATPVALLSPLESWRQQYFGTTQDTGNAADSFDYDGDGMSNAQEFAAGTDPTKAGDVLRATTAMTNGNFVITFPTVAGKTYKVIYSSTLQGGDWADLRTGITGTGGTIGVTDTGALEHSPRYYRIQVQ